MNFKALKTVLLIFFLYIGVILLSWWIFDFFYLSFNSTIKASIQIKSKEIIFYVISILIFLIFLKKIYKSNFKKEYFFGIVLLILWVVYQTIIWRT